MLNFFIFIDIFLDFSFFIEVYCNGSSMMDDDRCGQHDIAKIMCEEIAMSC